MKKAKKKPRGRRELKAPETQHEEIIPPIADRGAATRQIREILDRLFDGNAEEIVKSLADSGELTPAETARMKEVFAKWKGGKKK